MKRGIRFLAVLWACAGIISPALDASAQQTAAKPVTRAGMSIPTLAAPVNPVAAPNSFRPGLMNTRVSLSNLPVAPRVRPAAPRAGLSAAQLGQALGLPQTKIGFQPDAPPALPHSALYSPVPSAAQVGWERPEQAARGRAPGADAAGLGQRLKPGPGGEFSALQRQSLRISAKAQAVESQLRAAAGLRAPEGSDAFGLGRRVMDILTEENNYDAGGADVRAARAAAPTAASGLAQWADRGNAGGRAGGAAAAARYASEPGSAADAAYARSGTAGDASASRARRDMAYERMIIGLRDGVSRLALKVYRQSMRIVVVNVPIGRLASRLAGQAAGYAAVPGGMPADSRSAVPAASQRADDAAALEAVAWEAAMTLGSPSPLAETEIFSFMQASGQRETAAAPASSASGTAAGQAAAESSPTPASVPVRPIQAAAFLPFLGLAALALRSRP